MIYRQIVQKKMIHNVAWIVEDNSLPSISIQDIILDEIYLFQYVEEVGSLTD